MKLSKAVWICAAWITAALAFNTGIYLFKGQQKALEFLTGYVIEWSLSLDNLFVFFLIFSYFKAGEARQNSILSWGVLGAQLMRGIFIFAGVALLKHLNWFIFAFGALLVFSGFKLFFKDDKNKGFDQNIIFQLLNRFVPKDLSTFWIILIAVELADLVFAVDSIPAVLAVTKDPFIVYSSNIFAILGLRALYFVLSPVFDMFQYLHYCLGIILVFIGFKMLSDHFYHMPVGFALGFILMVLTIFIFISLINNNNKRKLGSVKSFMNNTKDG